MTYFPPSLPSLPPYLTAYFPFFLPLCFSSLQGASMSEKDAKEALRELEDEVRKMDMKAAYREVREGGRAGGREGKRERGKI